MSTFPTDAFSLEFRADLGIFIGRWLQDMPPPELQGTYQAMLEAARANGNCRFWLLHLRHAATLDSYPLFYDNEADAVAWLVEQQERAGMRPVPEAPQKNS